MLQKQREFIKTVKNYYTANKRSLQWRDTINPYWVLVSEIMLQQTQVARVQVKFAEFMDRFPTCESLAKSTLSDVLSVWIGLGYNRRAKYMHQAAQIIVDKYQGVVPQDVEQVNKLPGIGQNTASAIVTYSYNRPAVFIETNIRRVFLHHFFVDQLDVDDLLILPLVEQTLDLNNPRDWYYALMDYGSYLAKVVPNPNRRSRHHTTQSQFEGSSRQLRAKALKVLLATPGLTIKQIHTLLDDSRLDSVITQLVKERMIAAKRGRYYIS